MRIIVVVAVLLLGSGLPAQGGEPSARKLVARLTDGNEHVVENNRIVEQLVAKGEQALEPLRQALLDEEFEGRGYAAWALAKVLQATGERPLRMTAALHAAAASEDAYIRTLSKSALSILQAKPKPPASRVSGGKWQPNPYIVAALRDAPKPEASPEEMVAALAERKGHWRDIICDRLIMAGEKSRSALQQAADDESFVARKEAKRTLDRLTAALSAGPATPAELIAEFENGYQSPAANNALVDRLLLQGRAAIPALVVESKRPDRNRKGYADWALAKLLRATGQRPEEAMRVLTERYRPGDSPISILGL